MGLELRLRTRADVRLFSATITLIVVLAVNLWDYSYMSPAVFSGTRIGSNLISVLLAASISHFIGTRMLRVEELTQRLEHAANHDHLTMALTRMRFYQRCQDEAESLFPATLLVLDIDHFKAVNDRHGHDAGDVALRHVAQAIARNCRSTDLVARFGGEEFLVLMPGATAGHGANAAERIRMRIADAPITFGERKVAVTVSIGVAPAHDAARIDDAVRAADAALYRAKGAGRNRVNLAESGALDPALPAQRQGGAEARG